MRCFGLQDSFGFRCMHRARAFSSFLLDQTGELKKNELDSLIIQLEKRGHFFNPEGTGDAYFNQRLLKMLKKLRDDPEFFKSVKRFQTPLCHKRAEELILETLPGARHQNQ